MLDDLAHHVLDQGSTVLFKDLTHPNFKRQGLFCVRALVSNAYPMHFGHQGMRYMETARLSERLGGTAPNLAIHPLS